MPENQTLTDEGTDSTDIGKRTLMKSLGYNPAMGKMGITERDFNKYTLGEQAGVQSSLEELIGYHGSTGANTGMSWMDKGQLVLGAGNFLVDLSQLGDRKDYMKSQIALTNQQIASNKYAMDNKKAIDSHFMA